QGTQVLHRLFECRSRLLNGDMEARDAAGVLSGLLIARDGAGALELFAEVIAERTIHLIGTPQLLQLYASALAHYGHGVRALDGALASLAGLTRVHQVAARAETHAV